MGVSCDSTYVMANNLVAKFRDRKNRCPFSRKGFRPDQNNKSLESLTSYSSWKPPDFSKDKIRLVVYRESDNKGRKPLFDSKAVEKLETKSEQCKKFIGHKSKSGTFNGQNDSPCTTYQMLRPSSDSKMLGEMVFGSVAMSYMGSTTKVHVIRTPLQLMLTKVYVTSSTRTSTTLSQDSGTENGENSSSLCSCPKNIDSYSSTKDSKSTTASSIAHSMPMDMPDSPLLAMKRVSSMGDTADSGISRSASSESFSYLGSSANSMSSGGGGGCHSLIRRWKRFQVPPVGSSHHRRQSEDFNNSSVTEESPARQRCPKLGVSIIFNLFEDKYEEKNQEFKKFFFSHFALLEAHFHHLCEDVEEAYHTGNNQSFVMALMQSLEELRNAVYLLYTAPRIREPVWLNMMTFCNQRGQLLDRFLKELLGATQQCNNLKTTNNFLSRLLTAVLTHHLAWVPTVTPADAMPIKKYLEFKTSNAHHKILSLAKYHPYNPLWAQLGDLYGAIGYPMKQARTVVVGQRHEVVCRLLYVLTYFIRCSEVFENTEKLIPFNFFEFDKGVSEEDISINGTNYTLVSHLTTDNPQSQNTSAKPASLDTEQQAQQPLLSMPNSSTVAIESDSKNKDGYTAEKGALAITSGGQAQVLKDPEITEPAAGCLKPGIEPVSGDSETVMVCKEVVLMNPGSKKENVLAVGRSVRPMVNCSNAKIVGDGEKPSSISGLSASDSKERLSGSAALIPPSYLRLNSMEGSSSIFDEYFEDDYNNLDTSTSSSAKCQKNQEEADSEKGADRPSTLSLHHSSSHSITQTPIYRRMSSGLSSSSTVSAEDQLELPMPKSELNMDSIENQDKYTGSFGRSLLGGYSQDYLPDFALHGTKQVDRETIMKELTRSVQHSVLDDTVEDVVCIVADTDKWEVEVMSAKSAVCERVNTSNLVHNLLLSIQKLWQLKMSTEFCMIHLEDKLQEMYFKSKTLAEYVRSQASRSHLTTEKLSRELDVDSSDIQLLTAISTVYSLPEYFYADAINMAAPT